MALESTTMLVDKPVGRTGFGLLRLNAGPSTEEAIPVMKAALEAGCNLWSGAEYYGTPEYNSLHLVHSYFTKYPEDAEKVVLSIKGGYRNRFPDGSAEYIRQSVDNCNSILAGTKSIDIFMLARVDKSVPIETSLGALNELVKESKIGAIGLSEVGAEKIERACRVATIAAVELEVSLMATDIFHNGVSQLCAKHNVVIIAYGVLGRGQLMFQSANDIPSAPFLRGFPRFQSEAMEANMKLILALRKVAERKGSTMAQLCIGWIKAMSKRGDTAELIPIPGSTTVACAKENGANVELSEEDIQEIDGILNQYKVVGERYPPQMSSTWEE
jgi:pyridoxine 4-dehydrogenase